MKEIKLSGENSKEILRRLIYNEFHKKGDDIMPWEMDYQLELIETAKRYGLISLAKELFKDLE